jgi:hypothetical protein
MTPDDEPFADPRLFPAADAGLRAAGLVADEGPSERVLERFRALHAAPSRRPRTAVWGAGLALAAVAVLAVGVWSTVPDPELPTRDGLLSPAGLPQVVAERGVGGVLRVRADRFVYVSVYAQDGAGWVLRAANRPVPAGDGVDLAEAGSGPWLVVATPRRFQAPDRDPEGSIPPGARLEGVILRVDAAR